MTPLGLARLGLTMANGRRYPHPLLRTRIVELNEALNEQGRQADLADVKRLAWILGELERCGMIDFTAPTKDRVGGIFGQLAEMTGINPTVLWITVVLGSMWFGKPFIDFLGSFLPGMG